MTEAEEITTRFKLVCKKCGGENVVVNIEPSYSYSEATLVPGHISIGCNDCKKNDCIISI